MCTSGNYEYYGEWSEYYVREDIRTQLETPAISYSSENGLTVVADDFVLYYVYKYTQDGEEFWFYPEYTGEPEVITQNFTFPTGENTVYVKAVPILSAIKLQKIACIYIKAVPYIDAVGMNLYLLTQKINTKILLVKKQINVTSFAGVLLAVKK